MKTNLTVKGIMVGGLILCLLIPTLLISSLVNDRASRKAEVLTEVTSKWASAQTITGPLLIVPYLEHGMDNGKIKTIKRLAYFLPEHLDIKGDVQPQVRYRSIYKVAVYEASVQVQGEFSPLPLGDLHIATEDLLPSEARLCMGLEDLSGIEDPLELKWDDKVLMVNAGVPANDQLDGGFSASPPFNASDLLGAHKFSIKMRIKGSDNLYFTPLGKTTDVAVRSEWNDPSFDGKFLPQTKSVSEKGFSANWKVLYLNRNYPQYWTNGKYLFQPSVFGVSLYEATDLYTQTNRCVKYAILFIGLTFSLYFFMEIFQEKKVHVLQYLLVGLALCIFYTLLLSISEYLGFSAAYAIAAAATILLIALYTKGVFGKARVGWLFGSVLVGLYGFIYVLVQLEDGALLCGSIGLFLILALVMYYSKKVDWHRGIVAEPLQNQTI